MKKNTKITLTVIIGILIAGITGVLIYQGNPPDMPAPVITEKQPESKTPEVVVDINTERADVPEYKEIVDEETGKTVIAEVQVNEPIEQKSTTPPEKPKAEGSYTNPEQPPTYTQEQTMIEEKPKTNTNSNNNQSSAGKVYIDGFGYVEKAGETKTQTGVSDGDINKMVGSMD